MAETTYLHLGTQVLGITTFLIVETQSSTCTIKTVYTHTTH